MFNSNSSIYLKNRMTHMSFLTSSHNFNFLRLMILLTPDSISNVKVITLIEQVPSIISSQTILLNLEVFFLNYFYRNLART